MADREAVEAFMAALRAGGVSCDEPDGEDGWIDDTGDRIRAALLAAGWTEPREPDPAARVDPRNPSFVVSGSGFSTTPPDAATRRVGRTDDPS